MIAGGPLVGSMQLMRLCFLPRIPAASLSLLALLPALGCGALKWESQKIELTAQPGTKQAVGTFRFANLGAAAVTITSIHSSCGCTTADLAKRTYAPGESGEIKTVFTVGDLIGVQEKTITIATDETEKPVSLVLQVTIPELFTCSPRMLLWRLGDEPAEKSALIAATGTSKITTIEVKPAVPAEASTRLEAIDEGKAYRLFVRPASATKTMTAAISCVVRFTDGTSQPFIVNALVR